MNKYYTLLYLIIIILSGNIDLKFLGYFFIFFILFLTMYYLLVWYYLFDENKYSIKIDKFDSYFTDFPKIVSSPKKMIYFENSELYDSDDEDDFSISLNDLKYIDNSTVTDLNSKDEKKNVNIISVNEMINSDKITNINDLILLANYYEKNVLDDVNKMKIDEIDDNLYKKNNKTSDLYKYGKNYYTVNLEKIYKIRGPLIKLKKMVGLTEIKNEIIDMLLYYLTNFGEKNDNMLHMTLEGSPGCGKTKLAKIISKIMNKMNILDSDKIIYAKSTDLIGEYVGQTGPKTQKIIDRAMGGILFIDEAYALGSSVGREHNFSVECINVLNQNLSDNKNKFICIIAGYPEELNKMFFSANPGLKRRFPFRFTISGYSCEELLKIFINKIHKLKWKINKDVDLELFFKNNSPNFKYFGGDIDTFIQNIKYSYSRRVVCLKPKKNVVIENIDIETAFVKFNENRKDEIDKKLPNANKKRIINKIKEMLKVPNLKEIIIN